MKLVGAAEGKFDLVDEQNNVVTSGTLEVDYIKGAQRHGGVTFVSDEPTQPADTNALQQAAGGFGG